ncbi:MbnP family copper-binding protein [Gemmobacter nectariphilus]|uniref:MbnP family copper-binding protein n=1 Tax=Gemmobacter nectariphilus TaxID=220343 RepID=UPI0003FFD71C|nr:MbnP family copper-binding protein [Gemmobacter nectariphilus]
MKHALFAAFAATLAVPAFAGDMTVTIPFAAEIGGKPFACAQTYKGLGATGAEVAVSDFRVFVSQAALIRADGSLQPIALDQDGQWQSGDVALLDFEDATGACTNGTQGTHSALSGTVPEGSYTGLVFTVGVPFEQNHVDPTLAPAPLNTTAMFWNWQGGYKFVRIDLVPTDRKDTGPKGWFLHLGSTMCDAPSKTSAPLACKHENRIEVRLDGFDPARNTIVIDPAPVVAEADLRTNAPETSPGCMSFPGDADCMTVMARLGQPYMDVPAGTQALISMR